MRRVTSVGVLLALAAACVVAWSGPAAGEASSSLETQAWPFGIGRAPTLAAMPQIKRAQRLVLVAHDFAATVVDNDPAGTSQGDEISVEGRLSSRHEARNVGRLEAHEVLTSLNQNGGGRLQLMFTALLARGQISGAAVLGLTQSGASNARAAIIGGTGHYQNVRGEVLIHPNGQTTRLIFLLGP
jgi:hypothetical protein